jgi:hypothetical protein
MPGKNPQSKISCLVLSRLLRLKRGVEPGWRSEDLICVDQEVDTYE